MTRIFRTKTAVYSLGLIAFFGLTLFGAPGIQQGESGFGSDRAQAIALDGSGGIYVTGTSRRSGTNDDFLTLRYDADGHLLWKARYDGPAGESDYAAAIAADEDGHVYVAGHSNGLKTSLDLTVVKYDAGGNKMWEIRYDGPSHRDDYACAMALDSGGLYVTGYSFGSGTEHDYVTLKLDSSGEIIWAERYNSPLNRDDSAIDLIPDGKGGVIITGTDRVRATSYDFATIRYDAEGKQRWLARYSGGGADFDTAAAIAMDGEGRVCVTGYGYDRETGYDTVTLKYDGEGKRIWNAVYDGPASRLDMPHDIAADEDGNIYVAGKSIGVDSAFDMCLLKYGADGKLLWEARYDGPAGGADAAVSVYPAENSSVVIAGYSRGLKSGRDIVLRKYDSSGRLMWEMRHSGPVDGEDVPTSMVLDSSGNIFMTGYGFDEESGFDFITFKVNPEGRILWVSKFPPHQ